MFDAKPGAHVIALPGAAREPVANIRWRGPYPKGIGRLRVAKLTRAASEGHARDEAGRREREAAFFEAGMRAGQARDDGPAPADRAWTAEDRYVPLSECAAHHLSTQETRGAVTSAAALLGEAMFGLREIWRPELELALRAIAAEYLNEPRACRCAQCKYSGKEQ